MTDQHERHVEMMPVHRAEMMPAHHVEMMLGLHAEMMPAHHALHEHHVEMMPAHHALHEHHAEMIDQVDNGRVDPDQSAIVLHVGPKKVRAAMLASQSDLKPPEKLSP